MIDETKPSRSPVTWIGFVLAIALAIGWYADRSGLDKELAKARSERAAALAELAAAPLLPRPPRQRTFHRCRSIAPLRYPRPKQRRPSSHRFVPS